MDGRTGGRAVDSPRTHVHTHTPPYHPPHHNDHIIAHTQPWAGVFTRRLKRAVDQLCGEGAWEPFGCGWCVRE
jgi:hypothetical protein